MKFKMILRKKNKLILIYNNNIYNSNYYKVNNIFFSFNNINNNNLNK